MIVPWGPQACFRGGAPCFVSVGGWGLAGRPRDFGGPCFCLGAGPGVGGPGGAGPGWGPVPGWHQGQSSSGPASWGTAVPGGPFQPQDHPQRLSDPPSLPTSLWGARCPSLGDCVAQGRAQSHLARKPGCSRHPQSLHRVHSLLRLFIVPPAPVGLQAPEDQSRPRASVPPALSASVLGLTDAAPQTRCFAPMTCEGKCATKKDPATQGESEGLPGGGHLQADSEARVGVGLGG